MKAQPPSDHPTLRCAEPARFLQFEEFGGSPGHGYTWVERKEI